MGETFYREQQGPADSEVKQPGEGVGYHADSPTTYHVGPGSKNKAKPPGNNSPEHRDEYNPSSAKVIPTQMNETIREQLTYVNAARVASRYAGAETISDWAVGEFYAAVEKDVGITGTARTAATMDDIMGKTGPLVHQRSQELQVKVKRFSPNTGFWGFTVIGAKGTPYYVRIKGIRKSKAIRQLSKAQVKCSCSCPFWRWQGPEHWGKQNGFLYGRPRGTASFPVIRDPKEKHWGCKHILAALRAAQSFRFSSENDWSFDGELVPMPDPGRVAARFHRSPRVWGHLSPKADR